MLFAAGSKTNMTKTELLVPADQLTTRLKADGFVLFETNINLPTISQEALQFCFGLHSD